MNVKYIALAIVLVAANAHAGSDPTSRSLPQVSVYGSPSFVINCNAERTPTLREAEGLFGNESTVLLLGQPTHLARIAHRECQKGAARVAFVRDASPSQSGRVHLIAEVSPRP